MITRCRIWCPSRKETTDLSKSLVEKKLVAWTMITSWLCHYWREGEIVEKVYWDVSWLTTDSLHDALVEYVLSVHSDTCTVMSFTEVQTCEWMETWVRESIL